MKINIIDINKIKKSKCDIFTNVIYNNFIEIADEPMLKHTKDEIKKVFNSSNPQLYIILVKNKIASYLLGEIIKLNDNRNVLYITYIYTSKNFRESGFGSKLMETAEMICKKKKLNGIVLTCNTEDPYIYDFYLKKGFMPDLQLRTYGKYEVVYKPM
jgi:ribosomal protein S18 acetylase RimI-like enzyme